MSLDPSQDAIVADLERSMGDLIIESETYIVWAMDAFTILLDQARTALGANGWKAVAKEVVQKHPPSTRNGVLAARAFDKPRGYAGDAAMIDMIYDCRTRFVYLPIGELPRSTLAAANPCFRDPQ